MQTLDQLELTPSRSERHLPVHRGLLRFVNRRRVILLSLAVLIGFGLRVYRLDSAGLAEDEANKVFALRAYAHGDFTVNAEHPMLMKLLCFASFRGAEFWNSTIGPRVSLEMSEETALRLPNVLFGALSAVPLYLLATALLGHRVALIGAALWALGLEAIWFNRIAKEDSLLVFFMLSGYYLYNLAKRQPESEPNRAELFYALAGASFGLMFASKYFVHYFGLNSLYYTLVGYDSRDNRPVGSRGWSRFFASMLGTFTLVNPAVFFPQTWRYLWRYLNEELLTHHGYLVMDRLFVNDMTQTPGGNPWYFYFLFLGVKLPLPILLAFLVGLVEIFRYRGFYPRSRGYLFLRMMLVFWFLPMSVIGTKFLRYSLSLMPFFYLTAAVGVVVIWRVGTSRLRRLNLDWLVARRIALVAVTMSFVALPAIVVFRVIALSQPGVYLNAAGRNKVGYFFPHDEYYDFGARESIRFVADNAPSNARMASEIPGVVEYYLEKYGRSDIHSEIISQPGFDAFTPRDYVLAQVGRTYFENSATLKYIRENWRLVQASACEGGAPASEVYKPDRTESAAIFARPPHQ